MAGIYEIWVNPATLEKTHTFAIITVTGNKLLHKLPYSRMPVILEKGKENRWLKPDLSLQEILGQLQRYPSRLMNAYPISADINNADTYSPGLINPVGKKLLSEARPQMPAFNHYHHKVRK
jgi:putative SOS response-associated peptidase YedK